MIYNFRYDFSMLQKTLSKMSDEKKIETAKQAAAEDLAKILVDHGDFSIDEHGNVRGVINTDKL